jgi:hypothetical protein
MRFDTNMLEYLLNVGGIGAVGSDIIGGIWTPDQNWTWAGASFVSLGLNIGTYTVSDAVTSESIQN